MYYGDHHAGATTFSITTLSIMVLALVLLSVVVLNVVASPFELVQLRPENDHTIGHRV